MTSIDDSMLAAPVRQGKSQAKAGGLAADGETSRFRDAFDDVGRKKQPSARDDARAGRTGENDTASETADDPQKTAGNIKAGAVKTQSSAKIPASAPIGPGERTLDSMRGKPSDFLSLTADLAGSSAGTARPADSVVPKAESAAVASEQVEAANIGDDDILALLHDARSPGPKTGGEKPALPRDRQTTTADMAADSKLDKDDKGLAGKTQTRMSRPAPTGESSVKDDAGNAATGTALPVEADVSQLLTMLAAPGNAALTAPATTTQATPVISEFQALAERAGKPDSAGVTDTMKPRSADEAAPGAEETGASDRTFHFARATGKGQTVSLKVDADGDKTMASVEGKAGAKADVVTVLEARRYLGLAPASNASAITNAIVAAPATASAGSAASQAAGSLLQPETGKVLNTLKIQMHPIDLGMVTATLRLKDDELQVDLKVDSAEAYRQLTDDQGEMVKALRAQGFAVDQINIVFNASDNSGNTSPQQGQAQAGNGRDPAGNGTASQSRDQRNGDNAGGQRDDGKWNANEGHVDSAVASQPGSAGGVYI